MNASSTPVASSINQAISLLTTPLLMNQSPRAISTLRTVLKANLISLLPSSGKIDLHFRLSPYVLPPAPILASCVASGITWADWSRALGGHAFDLYVTNVSISIKLTIHDRPLTVWSATQEEDSIVPPISKIQHREVGVVAKRSLIRPPTAASTEALAVRIPQLSKEKKPSKLSQSFSPFEDSDEESDSDCSDASRPSSRLSTFSFGSSVDSDGSLTSVSTTPSPASENRKIPFLAPSKTTPIRPVVDHNNRNTTSYLYQGGCTRVMTGGVMLGKTVTSLLKSKPASRPAVPKPSSNDRSAALSWRRRF